MSKTPLLDKVKTPEDLRQLPESDLRQLADELRLETIEGRVGYGRTPGGRPSVSSSSRLRFTGSSTRQTIA